MEHLLIYKAGRWWDVSGEPEARRILDRALSIYRFMRMCDVGWTGILFPLPAAECWVMIADSFEHVVHVPASKLGLGTDTPHGSLPPMPTEVYRRVREAA